MRWLSNSFNWSGSKCSDRADHGVLGIVFESQFENAKGKKKEFPSAAWGVCIAHVMDGHFALL